MQSLVQSFPEFREEFVKYLFNSNQVEEESLEVLKNLKIVISGSYLVHNIIRYGSINLFQGFSKYQLSRYIKRLHECFQKYGIKTMIVFEGIVHNKDGKDVKANFPETTQKVKGTWQRILEDPKDPEIVKTLNELSYYFFTETEITKILDEFDIEYVHAPYFGISQMKWFVDYSYAHLVCCGLEGILFGFNNIIFDFDLNNGKFYWLDVKKLQKNLGLDSLVKVQSLFIVNGCNPSVNTFIPVNYLDLVTEGTKDTEAKEYSFDKVKGLLATNTNFNKILDNDEKAVTCHSLKRKLEYNLVFNSDCDVSLYPSNSYDVIDGTFGPYFPSEIYIFFVYNLIDRELIDSIANSHFVVRPPLSDSAEYHYHIDTFYKTMLEKIIGIFTTKLNPKFKTSNYSLIRFYFLDKSSTFTPREYKPAKFLIKQAFIEKEKSEQPGRSKRIGFCKTLQHFTEFIRETAEPVEPKRSATGPGRKESLDFVLSTKLSPLTKVQKNNSDESLEQKDNGDSPEMSDKSLQSPAEPNLDQPQTSQEILSYLYLSFLEMYDYVNTDKKSLMVIGAALRKCDENFEESLVMLLELMKPNLCLINGREFNNSRVRKASTEAAFNTPDKREHNDNAFYQINLWNSNVTDEEKEEIILLSRVFSLINASIGTNQPESTFADYDYDLCQYLGVLKHVQKMLRFSFESLMLNTYFSHCTKKDIKVFLGLKKNFPFRNNLNISLGIAIKKLLQTNETLDEFKEKNPHFINLEYNLKAGYILWENLLFVLRYQESKGEHPVELLELFRKANDRLMKRFRELRLLDSEQ